MKQIWKRGVLHSPSSLVELSWAELSWEGSLGSSSPKWWDLFIEKEKTMEKWKGKREREWLSEGRRLRLWACQRESSLALNCGNQDDIWRNFIYFLLLLGSKKSLEKQSNRHQISSSFRNNHKDDGQISFKLQQQQLCGLTNQPGVRPSN